MRAAYIESYGQTPTLTDLPDLEGELPVAQVLAAGLNPVDLMIAGGEYYSVRPKPPYTPGMEGVARRADGQLVYFGRPGDLKHGALAEQVFLHEDETWELADDVDPLVAISCGIAGLAGYLSVIDRGALKEGEKVVITGATGASGRIAVQAAKLAGASQVIAIGRSAERLEHAKTLGADDTVRFHGPMYYHEVELKELTDGGHDLTIDLTWGAPAMASLNSGKKGSRLVQVGNAASLGAGISATVLRGGNFTIQGFSIFNETLERRKAAFHELLAHVAAGRIIVEPETVPFEDLPAAWGRQEASPGTKLIAQISA